MPSGFPKVTFDELEHAGREHLDPLFVASYDAKASTDWARDIEALLDAGADSASTVVDLGAGTGTFAQAIAPHVARVISVDVSPAMNDVMRSRGLDPVQAGFLSYEHEGSPPDVVYTRNALHHLPDFWKAIALVRIARLVRPGGLFVVRDLVFSFSPEDAQSAIGRWLASAPLDQAEGWTADELAVHLRTEYSTFTWLLEPMLERAGFEIRDRWTSHDGIFAAFTCLRSER